METIHLKNPMTSNDKLDKYNGSSVFDVALESYIYDGECVTDKEPKHLILIVQDGEQK